MATELSDEAALALGPTLEFMAALWDVNHALEVSSKRMEATLGVTAQQRMVIRLIGRFPGLAAGRLASVLRVHAGTLSATLKRLEARGLITRRSDPADGRRVVLRLTAAGKALDTPTKGTVESAVERLFSKVPQTQIAITRKCLGELVKNLGVASREA